MFRDAKAFSGFSVNDLSKAREFYSNVLGLTVKHDPMGLFLELATGGKIFVYEKPDHQPASFTILNFPVEDIDKSMDQLVAKGIVFEQYDMDNGAKTDEKGVLRGLAANMGPDIAWFKDPAGNTLAVLQER